MPKEVSETGEMKESPDNSENQTDSPSPDKLNKAITAVESFGASCTFDDRNKERAQARSLVDSVNTPDDVKSCVGLVGCSIKLKDGSVNRASGAVNKKCNVLSQKGPKTVTSEKNIEVNVKESNYSSDGISPLLTKPNVKIPKPSFSMRHGLSPIYITRRPGSLPSQYIRHYKLPATLTAASSNSSQDKESANFNNLCALSREDSDNEDEDKELSDFSPEAGFYGAEGVNLYEDITCAVTASPVSNSVVKGGPVDRCSSAHSRYDSPGPHCATDAASSSSSAAAVSDGTSATTGSTAAVTTTTTTITTTTTTAGAMHCSGNSSTAALTTSHNDRQNNASCDTETQQHRRTPLLQHNANAGPMYNWQATLTTVKER